MREAFYLYIFCFSHFSCGLCRFLFSFFILHIHFSVSFSLPISFNESTVGLIERKINKSLFPNMQIHNFSWRMAFLSSSANPEAVFLVSYVRAVNNLEMSNRDDLWSTLNLEILNSWFLQRLDLWTSFVKQQYESKSLAYLVYRHNYNVKIKLIIKISNQTHLRIGFCL